MKLIIFNVVYEPYIVNEELQVFMQDGTGCVSGISVDSETLRKIADYMDEVNNK